MPGAQAATAPAALPPQTVFSHATRLEPGSHTAILQSLNRNVGGYWLDADQFARSVGDWSGIPIVFAPPPHPNLNAYDADAELELARVEGRVAGEVRNPRIESAGHPRLMAELDFAGDAEVERLCADGLLSLSTAFRARTTDDETAITSPPRPHHVLVFTEEPGRAMPVDPGAWILNATASPMDIANAGREFSAKNLAKLRSLFDQIKELLGGDPSEPIANAVPVQESAPEPAPEPTQDTDMTDTEGATAIANAVAEKDAALVELTNARSELAALREQIAKDAQAAKDAEWTAFKNAEIPPGWTDTPEKEAELRDEAVNRPLAFAKRLMTIPRPDQRKTLEQGAEFTNAQAADGLALSRELRAATGRV